MSEARYDADGFPIAPVVPLPLPELRPMRDVPRESPPGPMSQRYGIRQSISAADLARAYNPDALLRQAHAGVLEQVRRAMPGPGWVADVSWSALAVWGDEMRRRVEPWIPGTPVPPWADQVEVTVKARPSHPVYADVNGRQ